MNIQGLKWHLPTKGKATRVLLAQGVKPLKGLLQPSTTIPRWPPPWQSALKTTTSRMKHTTSTMSNSSKTGSTLQSPTRLPSSTHGSPKPNKNSSKTTTMLTAHLQLALTSSGGPTGSVKSKTQLPHSSFQLAMPA